MTTLLDIVIALLKGNRRKYRLFIICNVLSIGILFSLRLLLDNSSINDASIVDPMISSNVFAPNLFMHIFEAFFIPYTLVLLNRQIVKDYGILLSLGLSERQFVSCIMIENALLIAISVAVGMMTGVALEFGLLLIIKHLINLPAVVFSQNMETYYQTIVFLMVVYAFSVLLIVITTIRKRIFNIINDGRKTERKKGHRLLFIMGLFCFGVSLLSSFILYERTGGNILLLGIVLSYIGLALICCNYDFLLKKWREKWLFLISDHEYYHKTNIKLSLMLIALFGALLFMNTVSSVTESSLKNDVDSYYPYDIVFTQDKADSTYENIMESFDVKYQSTVPYFYSDGYSIFGVDAVNRETGNSFQIPEGHFLFVRSVVLNDGYVHEKGFVPSQLKINEESFELYEDIDRLLFCRGGGLTDSVILINQGDYERIAAGISHEKCLRLFRFGNKGEQHGLADYIERQSGSDVASYYEAYKRASQSAELLKLLMGYISTVILANAIIAIYYKIETEKEKDVYKYKLLLSLGAERNLIRKCIKEKLIAATFFPLFVSVIWMIIVSYINTFSYDHQVIAVCKCIGIGFTLGCLLYGVCKVYIRSILKEAVYTVTVL